jgi:hypothetical protein
MSKKEYYRGIEDPISGTFQLAEEVSKKADRIVFNSIFSLYFVWFSLIVAGLLTLTFFIQGKVFFYLISLSVFLTGIITVWLLGTVRKFLRKTSFRFSAIQAMREGPAYHRIPKGRSRTDRFLSYLKEQNRSFSALMKRRPELLRKDGYVVGRKERHHFDAFILRKAGPLNSLLGIGRPGYSLFIRETKKAPGIEDIKELGKELQDIYQKQKVYPNRVAVIFKARSRYSGLDEEAYDLLVEKRISIPADPKRKVNFQVVAELPDGNYDFVPFIPELKGYLP